jgi:hypothetical protein
MACWKFQIPTQTSLRKLKQNNDANKLDFFFSEMQVSSSFRST